MDIVLKFVAILGLTLGTAVLAGSLGPGAQFAPLLVLFGSVSFFLGPEADGSGFFVKGMYVDAPTPGCVWRAFGILLWIGAAASLVYGWTHRGA